MRIGMLPENDIDVVRLSVYSNDPGFDAESVQVDPQHDIGLRNMRERIAVLDGTCMIASDPHGVKVYAALPHAVIAQLASAPSSPLV